MKEYDYYLFDLFHTLVRIEPYFKIEKREYNILGITQSEWTSFTEYDYQNRALGYIKRPEVIVENIVKNINKNTSEEVIEQIYRIRKERFRTALVNIKPNILDTIKKLVEKGKTLILVSNADVFDKMSWDESPLSSYFSETIFSCDIGIMKPDKEIYLHAIQSVDANIYSSVFIGDGGHDELLGAKKIGLDTILTTEIINDLWPEKIDKLSTNADYIINKLDEILDY